MERKLASHSTPIHSEFLEHVRRRQSRLDEECRKAYPSEMSLALEIGCGHGHFLTEFAAAYRDWMFAGIDIIGARIDRGKRKQARLGLTNLQFFRAEASEFLDALPDWVRLRAVFVLFPDPWPKRRHHKNRLINHTFLSKLARRSEPGAGLYFRTDVPDYFSWTVEAVQTHDDWRADPDGSWPFDHETVFQMKADSHQSLVALRAGPATI